MSASVSATLGGNIQVSGALSLDCGVTVDPCAAYVTVSVFQEGCGVTSFTVSVNCDNTYSGTSTATFASGTYTVELSLAIIKPCCTNTSVAYRQPNVTVK